MLPRYEVNILVLLKLVSIGYMNCICKKRAKSYLLNIVSATKKMFIILENNRKFVRVTFLNNVEFLYENCQRGARTENH